jgi:hypothetical protein
LQNAKEKEGEAVFLDIANFTVYREKIGIVIITNVVTDKIIDEIPALIFEKK